VTKETAIGAKGDSVAQKTVTWVMVNHMDSFRAHHPGNAKAIWKAKETDAAQVMLNTKGPAPTGTVTDAASPLL
jgi:hypothetical protein